MANASPSKAGSSATRYAPALANPLSPLAEEVGRAVAQEVTSLVHVARHTTGKTQKGAAALNLEAERSAAAALEAKMTVLVVKVLEQSLSSRTAKGKALRMALIAKLANAEVGGGLEASAVSQGTDADALLTTAQAAGQLEVSRPYVSMLCDSGKLGQVVTTEGGHRRIRESAVKAYLATRTNQLKGAVSPRQAGMAAGLYDYPDELVKVVRGSVPAKPVKAAPTKAFQKSRS